MKKYLLLLVLAISSVTCFAQQRQHAITAQKEQAEDEKIIEVLEQIRGLEGAVIQLGATFIQEFQNGNYFLEPYINQLDILWSEEIEKQFLDVYYPYDYGTNKSQYVGGLTLEMAEQKYYEYMERIDELLEQMQESCELYFEKFVPFNEEYAVFRAFLDELAGKAGDYSINIQDNYNKAIESLKADFDTLFKEAEAAMYALSMDDTYLERVSVLRTAEDNLVLRAQTTTNTEKTIITAKETIDNECPDVKEYYLSQLDREEKDYNNIIRSYPLEKYIFDQEQIDLHIQALNKIDANVKVIVEDAKAAQKRYELCRDALAEATAEIDALQTAVENDCPDVWSDFTLDWNSLRSLLNNMSAGMGEAALSGDSTNGFLNSLNNLTKQAKEISDKAHAAQQGVTGIDAVEADGNADVEFYNLQGVKVNVPEAGMTLIKVDTATGKAQKVIIR